MLFEIKRENKKSIFGDLQSDSNSEHLIILVHGFKGFYKWGFFPEIQKRFLSHGCAVLSFNFSMNGVKRFGDEITDFNSFAENNFSCEQSDFDDVVSFTQSEKFPIQFKHVYGIGHSRGGGALFLAAANHPNYFTKIITWASISRIHHRLSVAEVSELKKCGFSEYVNGRTGDVLHVNYQFQKDLDEHFGAFDILTRVKTLTTPVCLIHGDKDETVSVKEAYELYDRLKRKNENELCIIKSATHTFNYDKKLSRLPWQLNEAITHSLYFLEVMGVSR